MINIIGKMKTKFLKTMKQEDGMGVVEVVLIVLVLVGLALLFKQEITTVTRGVLDSIKTQVRKF